MCCTIEARWIIYNSARRRILKSILSLHLVVDGMLYRDIWRMFSIARPRCQPDETSHMICGRQLRRMKSCRRMTCLVTRVEVREGSPVIVRDFCNNKTR